MLMVTLAISCLTISIQMTYSDLESLGRTRTGEDGKDAWFIWMLKSAENMDVRLKVREISRIQFQAILLPWVFPTGIIFPLPLEL